MPRHIPKRTRRPGSVLIIVLVVLALLSLGVYTFSEFMIVEAQATAMYGREAQARAAADSGVELAAMLLSDRTPQTGQNLYNNPDMFRGVIMYDNTTAKARGRCSVVAPLESDTNGRSVRFGLIDESAKLNLNTFTKMGLDDEESRNLLMYLPGMTVEIADAILDYIDEDQIARQFGAEDDYYLAQSPSYEAKNGPLDSLDELLMVRGVTPQLLYGEDANRNGMLDPNENDGDSSAPLDNADGALQHGWSEYLTTFSREGNRQLDGNPKININGNALADLYDQIASEMDETTAKFIVAFRISGAKPKPGANQSGSSGSSGGSGSGGNSGMGGGSSKASRNGGGGGGAGGGGGGSGGGGGGGQNGGGGSGGGGGNSGGGGGGSGGGGTQQLANNVASQAFSGSGNITRGGIDLSKGGSVSLKSLYELVGVQVQIMVNGVTTTLDSPWKDDPSDMKSKLPQLLDKFAIGSGQSISGRVNINQARREVLMGIPGMDEELVQKIIDSQSANAAETTSTQASERATTGWLVINGLTDLATLTKLDPYITARGDVYRLQSVGYFDGGGPVVRVEAVVDATQDPPQVIFQRDLTDLGRGYSPTLLSTGAIGK